MAHTGEIVMKETTVQHRKEAMDGELEPDEVKSGKNIQRPKATHLKTLESSEKALEEASEKSRPGEVKEGESKTKLKKREREKRRDVSGEKRARKDGGDEKALDVKESQVLKKSRRQEDSKVA